MGQVSHPERAEPSAADGPRRECAEPSAADDSRREQAGPSASAETRRERVRRLAAQERFTLYDLVQVMELLRSPGGCPWDREQTHESLKRYLIEEAYEVLEAIDLKDGDMLCEELGDVLLQVVFHADVADGFGIDDVATRVCRKMVMRHPHIFADVSVRGSADVLRNWEQIKRDEKGISDRATVLKKVPPNLPALMRAYKVQQKAADAGFDWDDVMPVLEKVREELREVEEAIKEAAAAGAAAEAAAEAEAGAATEAATEAAADAVTEAAAGAADAVDTAGAVAVGASATAADAAAAAVEEEIGDLFFAAVNLSRFTKTHPELALTSATEKFIQRFDAMEQLIRSDGRSLEGMALAEMDVYWDRVKHGGG